MNKINVENVDHNYLQKVIPHAGAVPGTQADGGDLQASYSDEKNRHEPVVKCKMSEVADIKKIDELKHKIESLSRELEERKRSEKALLESEEKFSAAFRSNANALILSFMDDGAVVDVNEQFQLLFGYSRNEVVGSTTLSIGLYSDPSDRQKLVEALNKGEKSSNVESVLRKRSGEEITCILSAEMLTIQHRRALLTTIHDISSRKMMENSLRASEERFRLLVESANSVIVRWDTEGKIRYMNDFGCRFFGYAHEELIGRKIVILLPHAEDSDNDPGQLVKNILAEPEKYLQNDNENIRKNGDIVWVSWTNKAIKNEYGEVREILAIGNDITERKRAEADLKVEHNILQAVINNIGTGFVVSDTMGHIQTLNPAAERIHDFSNGKVLNELGEYYEVFELEHPDGTIIPTHDWPLAKALRGEYIRELVVRLSKPGSEEKKTISYNTIPIYDGEGEVKFIVLTLTDLTDISERTKALEESEQRYISLFNNSTLGIVHCKIITDTSGKANDFKILQANNAYVRITGLRKEDVEGKNASELFPGIENYDYDYLGNYGRVALEGGELNIESYFNATGQWYSIYAYSPRKGEFSAFFTDITRRRKIEEDLRTSEQRLQGMFNNAAIGIVEVDSDDRIVSVNDSLCHILEYEDASGLLGKTISDITAADDLVRSNDLNDRLHKGDFDIFDYEKRYVRKDGSPIWVHVTVSAVRDKDGNHLNSIGTVEDITERRRALDALRKSEEKFRSLFENITEGVAICNMVPGDGENTSYRVLNANSAFVSMTGLSLQELTGAGSLQIDNRGIPADAARFSEVAITGKPYRFETFVPATSKHLIVNIISPGLNQFAIVLEDITDQKRNELEIKQKNEELTRFIYTVSHDLKSPLVTIKAFSSYLAEDIENNDREAREKDIKYIQNAADKMGRLLDELLELSRVGRKEKAKVEVPLWTVVQAALDLVAGQISRRNACVKLSGPEVMLSGYYERLVQLYQNLIDNAEKFMGDQINPVIELGTIMSNDGNNDIVLFVRDNGSGIDSRYHHKIFGLFEKMNNNTEGTGIGLALVKRIVEVHGGRIWFDSGGPGKGTTFYFTLDKTRLLTV